MERRQGSHRVTDTTTGRHANLRAGSPASREISCTAVYQRLSPLLGEPGPVIGTPAWLQLDDTDPAAWRSVLWAALQWAVAQDARQEHLADASKAIAAGENWAAVARSIHRRQSGLYIPRKAS
ncbi:DUF2742 domain-containing protein [Mycobacteroides abscessus]|uniref:DUF2742 domain-containing protein n=1 Tax=Mycobacteroides abscessus TaxID=36809 RepID=UPI00355ADE2A